jgi:outer membrane protein assembly factor BamB
MGHMHKTIGRSLSCFIIVCNLVSLGCIGYLYHNSDDRITSNMAVNEQQLKATAGFIDENVSLANSPVGWPMFHYNLAHTGYTLKSSVPSTNTVRWTYTTNGPIESSPAVANGRLYFISDGMYCLDAQSGDVIWHNGSAGSSTSSPAVVDGKVYVGARVGYDSYIYCFNAENGNLLWSAIPGIELVMSSPAVANGRVYIGSRSPDPDYFGAVYCFNASDGSSIWRFDTYGSDSIECSPTVVNAKVYFTTIDGYIFCVDAVGNGNGTTNKLWERPYGGSSSSPTVSNGKVYIGSGNGVLYCVNATTGSLLFSYTTGDEGIGSSPAVTGDKVYFGTSRSYGYDEAHVFCLNADNLSFIWKYTTPYPNYLVDSSPAVADGKVVFGTGNRNITCLNAETGALLWNYRTNLAVHSSPAIADGRVYVGSNDKKVYCFGSNNPPTAPDTPSGQTEGIIDESYIYSTNTVIDPDGDIVSYFFDWGDGATSEWISTPTASHAWASPGIYSVRVQAKDDLNTTSTWSSARIVRITNPRLVITATPPLVLEENNFMITVTLNDQSLEGASVTFIDESKITSPDGTITFSAPQVTHNTPYTITATYQDYEPGTTTITVLDTTPKPTNGFIYGIVSDEYGPVSGADVCAFPSNDPSTSYCTITDSEGLYVKAVPAGTYVVKAQYQEYTPATQSEMIVQERTAVEVNLAFQSNNPSPTITDETSKLVKLAINDAIDKGSVSFKLTISANSEDQTKRTIAVASYQDLYTIDIPRTDDLASFTISAETGTTATFVVLAIDRDVLTTENLQVTYDGSIIHQMSIERFIQPATNTESEPGYVFLLTSDGVYLAIYVPSFSTHTITVNEITSFFTGTIAFIFYLIVCTIVGVVVASPILLRTIRKLYFQKEK